MADQQEDDNRFTHPPVHWEFNHFIANICQRLNERDLDTIKLRFMGIIGAEAKTLEEAFYLLKVKGYISQKNLIYLQVILQALDRSDLLARTIEYADKTKHSVLYFEENRTEIRPGHEIVQLHVSGASGLTELDMNAIRCTISQTLWVPVADIVFNGVQPNNSVYITFTLPKFFVDTLKHILENKGCLHVLKQLVDLGIDEIIVYEVRFPLKLKADNTSNHEVPRSDNTLQILQTDLQQKASQIKMLEEECLKLKSVVSRYSLSSNKSKGDKKVRKRKALQELKFPYQKRAKFEEIERLYSHTKALYHESDLPLKKYDTPPRKRNLCLRQDKLAHKKLLKLAILHLAIKKNTFEMYKQREPCLPTIEEINTQSLYTKINRIFPVIEDPRKKKESNKKEGGQL